MVQIELKVAKNNSLNNFRKVNSMKKIAITFLFFFSIYNSSAQQISEVTTLNWNIFFASTGNYFSFNSNGFDPNLIEIKLSDGEVQRYYTINSLKHQLDTARIPNHVKLESALNFQAGSINKRVTVSIHYKFGVKDSIIWQKKYYVVQLPDPTVYIGDSLTDATFTRDEMLKMYNLGAYMPDFKPYTSWFITAYDCQYLPPDGNSKSYHVEKNIFTPELHKQIEACKPGDTFIFRNVRVDGLDAYTRYVNSVFVTIK
ncbi:hypothetical protein LBMAG27_02320 [Bacteroidota bacterium]|nr:hypothetical protein LBMAG27_02320 [Bacteroidota bacterium]